MKVTNSQMIQGVLDLGSITKPQICKICRMSYYPHIKDDKTMHIKYHMSFVNGPKFEVKILEPIGEVRILKTEKAYQCKVFKIPKNLKRLLEKMDSVMNIVNTELNAPKENPSWKFASETLIQGHAFVVIIEKHLVAVCTTEPISDLVKQSHWMRHETQEIVPELVNKRAKLGISRIWVAPKWRRLGLGSVLLNSVLSHLVYGMTLDKREITFSQPSYSGGLLAKSYVGVKSKNGDWYVPIYSELSAS